MALAIFSCLTAILVVRFDFVKGFLLIWYEVTREGIVIRIMSGRK